MKFEQLPKETQNKVKSVLCAYDNCIVERKIKTGEYIVSVSVALLNHYTTEFVMKINKNDIYTEDEQIVNYVNEFRSYPVEYKGNKDYRDARLKDRNYKAIMINGNIDFKRVGA